MADRLISANRLINDLVHKYGRDCGDAVLEIDKQPEAVVRCKDCKHFRDGGACVTGRWDLTENDFCSWGERREE